MKITKAEIFNIFEWISVLLVSIYMVIYGVAKPFQFGEIMTFEKPINKMDPMTLMWAFYSYSKTYAIIIGLFEISGAILYLIPKTRLFGGLILSCILINIILQDYFFKVDVGALANAILFQLLIFITFIKHRKKFINAFHALKCDLHYKFKLIYIPIAVLILATIELAIFLITFLLNLLLS